MDTEKKGTSNVKVKKSGRKNEKKKKAEAQDTDITLEEVCQQMSQLADDDGGGSVSASSTDSEDLVNAINYNTITSLAALKDIIQGDNNDTPETDSFFQHYFMNHCNSLSSRNSNSPFPFPERRRLSQCREEDEDDERKDGDLFSSNMWDEVKPKIVSRNKNNVAKHSNTTGTEDQNANVVSEPSPNDGNIATDGQEPPKRTVMGARHKFLVTTTPQSGAPPSVPPPIKRIVRSHVHNAHTVHFGTKGAEEQRPNVRTLFEGENLHLDKKFFDSSLIEIRSTVDGVAASSEDIWVKRTEDKVSYPRIAKFNTTSFNTKYRNTSSSIFFNYRHSRKSPQPKQNF